MFKLLLCFAVVEWNERVMETEAETCASGPNDVLLEE